jgi:hypothetical protein
MRDVWLALAVYGVGVAVGLWRADASVAKRLLLAFLWPLGPLAAAVTLPVMALAALVLFPLAGLLALAGGLAGWWLLGSWG